jgi:hypothetical protein
MGKLPMGPGVAADHPNNTGKPPLKPPSKMLEELRRFKRRLYTTTLSRIPSAIHKVDNKLSNAANISDIETSAIPNRNAALGSILPLGNGRL